MASPPNYKPVNVWENEKWKGIELKEIKMKNVDESTEIELF